MGISAGGTSVDIINYINQIGLSSEMYSVDLAEQYYRDPSKSCGYLINDIHESKRSFHKLMVGKILPKRFEEIGDNIDLLILDTVHLLSGETLDFLAALPFLSDNAIVVLHDIMLHYYANSICSIATNSLLNAVTG